VFSLSTDSRLRNGTGGDSAGAVEVLRPSKCQRHASLVERGGGGEGRLTDPIDGSLGEEEGGADDLNRTGREPGLKVLARPGAEGGGDFVRHGGRGAGRHGGAGKKRGGMSGGRGLKSTKKARPKRRKDGRRGRACNFL
jgi:hypothetical protein